MKSSVTHLLLWNLHKIYSLNILLTHVIWWANFPTDVLFISVLFTFLPPTKLDERSSVQVFAFAFKCHSKDLNIETRCHICVGFIWGAIWDDAFIFQLPLSCQYWWHFSKWEKWSAYQSHLNPVLFHTNTLKAWEHYSD